MMVIVTDIQYSDIVMMNDTDDNDLKYFRYFYNTSTSIAPTALIITLLTEYSPTVVLR